MVRRQTSLVPRNGSVPHSQGWSFDVCLTAAVCVVTPELLWEALKVNLKVVLGSIPSFHRALNMAGFPPPFDFRNRDRMVRTHSGISRVSFWPFVWRLYQWPSGFYWGPWMGFTKTLKSSLSSWVCEFFWRECLKFSLNSPGRSPKGQFLWKWIKVKIVPLRVLIVVFPFLEELMRSDLPNGGRWTHAEILIAII